MWSKLLYFNYRIVAKVLLFIIPLAILARVYWPEPPVEVTFMALRWDAKLDVTDQQEKNNIVEAMRYMHQIRHPGPPKQLALYSMIVSYGRQQQEYLITETGEFFRPDGTAVLPSYRLREIVQQYTSRLERQSPYGRLISWTDARRIFSRYTKATVEDLDTGLRFDVQRRAGNYHADVQPITAEDTAIMKEIYDGSWSWRRRAIIVEVGNQRLAASMNGMPHGAGMVRNNNFAGHFCIHFKDSATHQNPQTPNLEHQIMVWKAAGRIPELLATATPEEVVKIFFAALAQRAPDICLQTVASEPALDAKDFIQKIKNVNWTYYEIIDYDRKTDIVKVRVEINFLSDGQNIQRELGLKLVHSLGYWWKIDFHSLNQVFVQ